MGAVASTVSPRAERATSSRMARGAAQGTDQVHTDASSENEKQRSASRAQFSAMLALIFGAGQHVPADQPQLPSGQASLVDRLLDDATAEPSIGLESGDEPSDAERTAADVSEALRYGILNTTIQPALDSQQPSQVQESATRDVNGSDAETRDGVRSDMTALQMSSASVTPDQAAAAVVAPPVAQRDVIDLPTFARSRRTGGAADTARTIAPLDRGFGRQGEMEGERRAQAVLSRIATKGGASLEQMMAIGDVRGAGTRVALDALLAKAGTPAGAEIAGAASTTAGASAADPNTPVRALEAVAPELRSRVQRVIDRMKGEYGHDVTIVETARSQERQDLLFEQGRTRPGAVVTWTRDSAHTRGEAVDVIVDGSWENASGFARLQRIAREEGLRTLGMRDPGHLELASRGESSAANSVRDDRPAGAASATAAPAGIAQVATVADVATVARTAQPAAPATPATPAMRQAQGSESQAGTREDGGSPSDGASRRATHKRESTNDRAGADSMYREAQPYAPTAATTGDVAPGRVAGSEQAARVAEVQAMRADAPAAPLSRMTLNLDNANGTQDRITVDLRGNIVDTFISTDAASAEQMKMRTGELQESLSRHGLDADSVRISGTVKTDSADAPHTAGTEREALRATGTAPTTSGEGAQSQNSRDRSTDREWDRQQDARREQKEQAARDQQREQADQRGWQNLFNWSNE